MADRKQAEMGKVNRVRVRHIPKDMPSVAYFL